MANIIYRLWSEENFIAESSKLVIHRTSCLKSFLEFIKFVSFRYIDIFFPLKIRILNLTLKFNGDNSFLKLYRNYIKAYINLTFGLYNINRTNRDGDFNEIISFDM